MEGMFNATELCKTYARILPSLDRSITCAKPSACISNSRVDEIYIIIIWALQSVDGSMAEW